MASPAVAELNERFGSGDKSLSHDVVVEMQSIMRLHDLSPEDLYFKWESYCIKLDMDAANPSLDKMRDFKQGLQNDLEKSTRTQVHSRPEKRVGATPRASKGADVFGMIDGLLPNTPSARKSAKKRETPVSRVKSEFAASSPDFKSPANHLKDQLDSLGALPPSSFHDRTNPGEVIEVLNGQLPAPEPPIAPFGESRIKLTAASDQKKLAYKPLGMKLSEASEILDDRIDDFLALIKDHHKLDDDAFGSAAAQSTAEIVAVGRIASDSLEGRLNAASLVLETSRRTGQGFRIPLSLEKLTKGHQFFPGQIVALRGSNASGKNFAVTERLEAPLLPNAASAPAAMSAHRQKFLGGPDAMDDDDSEPLPLNIIYAAGPYTADDNLDFEPLHQLCTIAADTYADALVLTGPFLDVDHPLLASGDFDLPDDVDTDTATMSTAFRHMVSPAFSRLVAANPTVTILLIPSTRDVIDKHVSWPQDTFVRKELGLPKSVKIVGNPMTLSLNEMVLGISSQDVLWELKGDEVVSRPAPTPDLLARLSRHLIEQRHYFPVFPPMDRSRYPKTGTVEGVAEGAMLDVSFLKLGEMVGVRPDVLVVPSALPAFAKVVESVLAINPGYLSKRRGAGTYARMTLYPASLTDIESSEGMMGHKIFDRARVAITRI